MYVIKRDGRREDVKFDKITSRIQKLCYGLSEHVDPVAVAMKVIEGIYEGVSTSELDSLAAEVAASMTTRHPDFAQLAARIAVSNLHKNTTKSFSETMRDLYEYVNPKTNLHSPLLADDVFEIIMANASTLDSSIIYDRDFGYDYFGFKTLERSYLLRINGKVWERPQHMLMRVAVGIHKEDLEAAIETYDLMSKRYFTHATPTLFNSGTPKPQMSSCFLLTMRDDSIDGIYDTLKQCSKISQSAGGIGLSIHNVRATGSYIRGTNGTSNGIVPMLRVFNDTARYVDQGGGKRKGSFAVYIEPWHADIFDFLDLKKNHGKEEMRARDLFYALWTPDLFMKRVEDDSTWTLMCPNECPGLYDSYGAEFEALYTRYEAEGKGRRTVKARELWQKVLDSQIETGTPYMLYKDAANEKSNQKNLGVIRSSNLCTEIMEYSAKDEVAVCNLASLALPMFVTEQGFDHVTLYEVTRKVTRNLNRIIDRNYYPVKEARNSNMRHRPVGLGVQGLADAFIKLRLPFTSEEAKKLNSEIFETMYFAALSASMEEAKADGAYESYEGSPISKGLFQFNLWGVDESSLSGRWDWKALRAEIQKYGVRNSLLLAPMPTASTSQILGNNECFEPYTSNIYTRKVLSGEFVVVNKHLLLDLVSLGLWDEEMKNDIIRANGSVQGIDRIPANVKELYKTVWEMSMKDIIDMSADRGIFIDQSQSLNLFIEVPNTAKLTSMHFYAWKKGLKTGMYYLRSKGAADAIKFTVQKQGGQQMTPGVKKDEAVQALSEAPAAVPQPTAEIAESSSLESTNPAFALRKAETAAQKLAETLKPEVKSSVAAISVEPINSSVDGIACSLDDPEGCEMCGS